MLYGMSLLYGASGSLFLSEISEAFVGNPDLALVVVPATLMMLVGLGLQGQSRALLPVDAGHL